MQARFLLGPAGSGKTFRCLAEIRAALADDPDGDAADFARAQTGHVPARTPVARRPVRLPATRGCKFFPSTGWRNSFLKSSTSRRRNCCPTKAGVMVLRALLLRHADELKLFRGSARRPGFAQELGTLLARIAAAPVHARQTPRVWRRRKICAANSATSCTTSRCSRKNTPDWLREHELQDANHLLDFATDALLRAKRNSHNFRHSKFTIRRLVAGRFRRNDAAGTGFARRRRAVLRTRHARLLPRNRARRRQTSWLSIWSAIGKTFQQCRAADCQPAGLQSRNGNSSNARRAKTVSRKFRAGAELEAEAGRCQTSCADGAPKNLKSQISNLKFPSPPAPIPKPRPCSPRAKF